MLVLIKIAWVAGQTDVFICFQTISEGFYNLWLGKLAMSSQRSRHDDAPILRITRSPVEPLLMVLLRFPSLK